MPNNVVIVGASAAGLTAAEALRAHGYSGTLTLVGEESHAPYDRPPLSKQILAGAWQPQRVALRSAEAFAKLDAALLLGRSATGLDPRAREVRLDDGRLLGYDGLVIATGVTPRRIPGCDLPGVHLLRKLDDALALRAELLTGPRLVVVGAGFLGAEVAAVARTMGLEVTLVDPSPLPLSRLFGARVGQRLARLHTEHGTKVLSGSRVRRLLPATEGEPRIAGAELADGSVLKADAVVVAVGSTPAISWLTDSGLPLADGVTCDATCRAAPGVYAAGDVASWPNPHFGIRMRLEHRMNATEQARAAAGNLLGDDRPFAPVPYLWTDQYDVRIQAHGIFPADAEMTVLSGDPDEGPFTAAYGHRDRVVGVLAWNSPREIRRLRSLVAEHTPWPIPD
ncbi:FAD-dependent oxidoreductase [Catenulispora sp. NL8]|uniref:FAD-dependent oxidoreductase n=1 Tax=Catenulispora pinistramenti TaxID=2705254 RepID=A0ABS5KR30_9ACTN|nr:FAD-dependent oxidoreductase [Catenulispora pinistramenti]MBS2548508.1 FAD-dependent oxidoreductase [Catenulispora pinistramenti]